MITLRFTGKPKKVVEILKWKDKERTGKLPQNPLSSPFVLNFFGTDWSLRHDLSIHKVEIPVSLFENLSWCLDHSLSSLSSGPNRPRSPTTKRLHGGRDCTTKIRYLRRSEIGTVLRRSDKTNWDLSYRFLLKPPTRFVLSLNFRVQKRSKHKINYDMGININ